MPSVERHALSVSSVTFLQLREHDDEREEHERLDEHEAENHHRLYARARAGVARDALGRGGRDARLADGRERRRQCEAEPRRDGLVLVNRLGVVSRDAASLRERMSAGR